MRWYEQQLKITIEVVADYFYGLSNDIVFYIGLDIVAESWLVVFLGQQLTSLLDAKIAGQRIVKVTANQLRLKSFGYKW